MTVPPEHFAERPAMPAGLPQPPPDFADPPLPADAGLGLGAGSQPHDLLSELLRSVRLSGERIAAYAPPEAFSIGFADTGTLHFVEEGELILRTGGHPHPERL